MESILAHSVAQNASDVHLTSGEKPIIRKNGQLYNLTHANAAYSILDAKQLENYLFSLLNPTQKNILSQQKQLDFAYSSNELGRFRANVFYHYKGISAVFRIIKQTMPSLDEIRAPEIFKSLIQKEQGLILVTGATGSGKSTTLAAMIQSINQSMAKHIITLEEPIEFIYQNEKSLIQQREIFVHSHHYADALNAILRQDPDIILIGELRDRETIQAALTAAETGHLVLATLHTNSAIHTINRIVDVFDGDMRDFIRTQLADSLLAVICQQLTNDENGRKALFEILINIPAVSHLIAEGKTKQIISIMQTSQQYGMQLMR